MKAFVCKFLSLGFFLVSVLMAFLALYFDSYKMTPERTTTLVLLLAITIPVCLISLIIYIYDNMENEPEKFVPYTTISSTSRDYHTIWLYYISAFFVRLLLPIIFISLISLPIRNIPGIADYKMPFLLGCYMVIILYNTFFMIYEGEETIRLTPSGISFYRFGEMRKFFPYKDFLQAEYTPMFLPFIDIDHLPVLIFKTKQKAQHKEGCFLENATFTILLNDIRSLRERGVLSDYSAPSSATPHFEPDPTLPAKQQLATRPADTVPGIISAPEPTCSIPGSVFSSGTERSLPEQSMQQTSIQQPSIQLQTGQQPDFRAMKFTFSTSWFPGSIAENVFIILVIASLFFMTRFLSFRLMMYAIIALIIAPFACIYNIVTLKKQRLHTLTLEENEIKADDHYISIKEIAEIRLTSPNSSYPQQGANSKYRILYIMCGMNSPSYVVGEKLHQPKNNPIEYQKYVDFYMHIKEWCQQQNITFTDIS